MLNNLSKKITIIDTNILIEYPDIVYDFDNIILPIIILEELDNIKKNKDLKGLNARKAIKNIIENNIEIDCNLKTKKILEENCNDNKIINYIYNLKKNNSILFITNDLCLIKKAKIFDIETKSIEIKEENNKYLGWRKLKFNSIQINELFKNGYLKLNNNHRLIYNEFVSIESNENNNHQALCKYNKELNQLEIIFDKNYNFLGIKPINLEQRFTFNLLNDEEINLVCIEGKAGTGKTLISIAYGLHKILKKENEFEKLIITKPNVEVGKSIGFMPGTLKEKMDNYLKSIYDNLDFLIKKEIINLNKFGGAKTSEDVINYLIKCNLLEIESLSLIRGRSLNNCILICDECQNMTSHEIKTLVSRIGDNSKLILTGDIDQIDLKNVNKETNGLSYVIKKLLDNKEVGVITLEKCERSKLAELAIKYL